MVALINYSEGEMGYEMPFNDKQHGIFTYHAIKVLKENRDLTYFQLIEKVNIEVKKGVKLNKQTALLQCFETNKDKVFFRDNLKREEVQLPMVHALLVGIDDYNRKNAPNLKNSTSNCNLIAAWLEKRQPATIDKLYGDYATVYNIVEELKTVVSKTKEGEFLFFFYAGHTTTQKREGLGEEDEKLDVFLTSDASGLGLDSRTFIPIIKNNPKINFVFWYDGDFPEIIDNLIVLNYLNDNALSTNLAIQILTEEPNIDYQSLVTKINNNKEHTISEIKSSVDTTQGKFQSYKIAEIQCVLGNEKKIFLKELFANNEQDSAVLTRIRQNQAEKGESLSLFGLNLTQIPNEVFELTHLKSLDLYDNALEEIPNAINKLTLLENLLVSKNKMSQLPDTLADLKNLKKIKLDENQFEVYPSVLNAIQSLENISLEDNQIRVLPSETTQLPNLKLLDLRGNPLMNIPREKLKFLKNDLNKLFEDIKPPVNNYTPVMVVFAHDYAFETIENALKPVLDNKQLQIIRPTDTPLEWYKQLKPYERNIALLHVMFLNGKDAYEQYFTTTTATDAAITVKELLPFLGKPKKLRLCFLSFGNSQIAEKAVLDYGFDFCISAPATLYDREATQFIETFYKQLVEGKTVEKAYDFLKNVDNNS